MRLYEKLYMGEKAAKKRPEILKALREGRRGGYYVITPAANGKDLLDIISAVNFSAPPYTGSDCLVIGLAADRDDAAELAGRIVTDVLRKTGGFDVRAFFAASQ